MAEFERGITAKELDIKTVPEDMKAYIIYAPETMPLPEQPLSYIKEMVESRKRQIIFSDGNEILDIDGNKLDIAQDNLRKVYVLREPQEILEWSAYYTDMRDPQQYNRFESKTGDSSQSKRIMLRLSKDICYHVKASDNLQHNENILYERISEWTMTHYLQYLCDS